MIVVLKYKKERSDFLIEALVGSPPDRIERRQNPRLLHPVETGKLVVGQIADHHITPESHLGVYVRKNASAPVSAHIETVTQHKPGRPKLQVQLEKFHLD